MRRSFLARLSPTRLLALAALLLAGPAITPGHYPLRYEGIEGYQQFVGATSAAQIPTLSFTLPGDRFFDEITYTIGPSSSLLRFVQTSTGISKAVFHDRKLAAQIDENGAVASDNGWRLKDLVTQEALITGRIAFMRASTETLRGAHILVPGGWPVDLTFTPGGRLWKATIHGTDDAVFSPLTYGNVAGLKVVTDWDVGQKNTQAISAQVSQGPAPPSLSGPAWQWRTQQRTWTSSFVPYNSRPMMPIAVNGVSSECILDTGSAGLMLSGELAVRAGVHNVGPALTSRSVGESTASYGRADVVAGPVELRSAVVVTGLPIPGDYAVCGYDFLASFLVRIVGHSASVVARPMSPPPCKADCVRVDTWARNAIASMRIESFSDRGLIDTGADDPLVVDALLKYSGGVGTPVDCGSHTYVQRALTIGTVAIGPTPACYASFDDSSYKAVVGAALLAHYRLTLDLGDRMLWLAR